MDLQQKLNQKGLRFTEPRRAVLAALAEAQAPLSPQSIHERTAENQADISLVSVYRTLDLLAEFDLVRRVHGPNGCHGYVLASPGHHHSLVCEQCGQAVEFSGTGDLNALLESIENQTGFQIKDHLLQLSGLCPNCQKGNQ